MLKFIREDANPVMDELFDVLGKLLDILQTSSAVVQKTYTKMLRTTEVNFFLSLTCINLLLQ
jgi:hypothetical protein